MFGLPSLRRLDFKVWLLLNSNCHQTKLKTTVQKPTVLKSWLLYGTVPHSNIVNQNCPLKLL